MKPNKKFLSILLISAFLISVSMTFSVAYQQQDDQSLINEVDDPEDDPENDEDDDNNSSETNDSGEEDEDEDGDNVDDDFEDENEREIKVEYDDDEIQIKSELKNGDSKDEIEIKVKAGDDLGIKLEYQSETTLDSVESELEVEFKVMFKSLIEFIDLDGNGIFNSDNDTEIQEYKLNNFSAIEYTPEIQPDNSTLHYLKISTVDNVFTAHLYIAGEFMDLNTTIITPTELKIDIEISNFPYLNGSSQLALYTKLETEYELEENDETEDEKNGFVENESGVITSMNGFMADFTWAETALVDGTVMKVLTTPINTDDIDPNDDKIYIIYPRGTHIYHDPKIGMVGILLNTSSLLENIPGFPLWTIFAFSATIIAIITLKYKKNQI
ncbi:MAG: Loki-CTERM sorting domain-containing protein [Promethearchaeota archaeon]